MKRSEWLTELERELARHGLARTKEILADYEEHFAAAVDSGKTEEDVAAKLGEPKAVAKAHLAESLVTKVGSSELKAGDVPSIVSASLRLLVLTPFTFLMMIGPGAMVALFMIVGWSLVLLFGGLSVAALFAGLFAFPLMAVSFWGAGALVFGVMAFVGGTLLAAMTMWILTKWTLTAFVSFLRWNVDFVLEKKGA